MNISIAVLIVLLLAGFGATAQSNDSALWQDRPFLEARRDLLEQGWKPFESSELDPTGMPYNRNAGMEEVYYDAGIIEVQKCTQGQVYCRFNYTRGKQCLLVITKGENDPRISLWKHSCFEPLNK